MLPLLKLRPAAADPGRDFHLAPGDVDLWYADVAPPSADAAFWWELLSPEERDRAERFRFEQHRVRFVAVHGFLRVLLGRYTGQLPAALLLASTPRGKPYLVEEGSPPLKFNLSHTADVMLAGFALGREIGVDVEKIDPDIEHEDLSTRFFSTREAATIRSLPACERTQAFFACWARKEAYIKATGEGLAYGLNEFDVSLRAGEAAALLADRRDPCASTRWCMHALDAGEGFAAAVVVAGQGSRVRCRP